MFTVHVASHLSDRRLVQLVRLLMSCQLDESSPKKCTDNNKRSEGALVFVGMSS